MAEIFLKVFHNQSTSISFDHLDDEIITMFPMSYNKEDAFWLPIEPLNIANDSMEEVLDTFFGSSSTASSPFEQNLTTSHFLT